MHSLRLLSTALHPLGLHHVSAFVGNLCYINCQRFLALVHKETSALGPSCNMSHRFPPIPSIDLSPDQRVATTKLSQMFGDNPVFKYQNEAGSMIGPYSVLLYAIPTPPPYVFISRGC